VSGPSQAERVRSLRPWFLVAAMVLVWLVGVQGVNMGCQSAAVIRGGAMPDTATVLETARDQPDPSTRIPTYVHAVQIRALVEHGDRTLPLAIAQTLLSLLLVVASAMVLSGRQGAKSFALQVFATNVAFLLLDYGLTQPARDQVLSELARADLASSDPAEAWLTPTSYYLGLTRFAVGIGIAVPVAAALALFSKRTQVFFDAAERAEQRREREDEP
jgi:hypothetical protein